MTTHRATCTDCSWSHEGSDLVAVSDAMEDHVAKEVGHDVDLQRAVATDGGVDAGAACWGCGGSVSPTWSYCPHCGEVQLRDGADREVVTDGGQCVDGIYHVLPYEKRYQAATASVTNIRTTTKSSVNIPSILYIKCRIFKNLLSVVMATGREICTQEPGTEQEGGGR